MRCHRAQPEPMERGQFSCYEEHWDPVHSQTEWRRNCVSCSYFCAFHLLHFCETLILTLQDLGNTNFSIHLPRTSFDRHATGQIVLRAVRSLGVDAHVNDRNDICVGKHKMSVNFCTSGGRRGSDRQFVSTSLVQLTRSLTNVHIIMVRC